mmetsp:Transcript_38492/g.121787  ORF Transcript_38492/g.121787 Transcript_38492/m.121787 type:complete len:303 (-) Transcript_38492:325-1233(-)
MRRGRYSRRCFPSSLLWRGGAPGPPRGTRRRSLGVGWTSRRGSGSERARARPRRHATSRCMQSRLAAAGPAGSRGWAPAASHLPYHARRSPWSRMRRRRPAGARPGGPPSSHRATRAPQPASSGCARASPTKIRASIPTMTTSTRSGGGARGQWRNPPTRGRGRGRLGGPRRLQGGHRRHRRAPRGLSGARSPPEVPPSPLLGQIATPSRPATPSGGCAPTPRRPSRPRPRPLPLLQKSRRMPSRCHRPPSPPLTLTWSTRLTRPFGTGISRPRRTPPSSHTGTRGSCGVRAHSRPSRPLRS